jgi:NodT family efflux transporter outer membrane factor (OMF) lipoprotein
MSAMRCSSLLLIATCILLAGCEVGPNYRRPDAALINTESAKGSFVGATNAAVSEDQPPDAWWQLYDDPRLDGWIREALSSNTDLRKADANLARSRASVQEIRALRQPNLAVSAGVQYAQLAGEQYLQRITPPRDTYYDTELTVAYDLDLFGGIRRGIEAAQADDEAVEAARDLVRVNVVAETLRAYADACGAGQQLTAAEKTLRLQSDSLALTDRLYQGGRATTLDVTRIRQLVDQQTGVIPPLEAARRNALFRMATLTGKPPLEYHRELESCDQPPRLLRPLPVGNGAELLSRRPDVREAERQLSAATASIGVQTAALYPDIVIAAPLGSLGAARDAYTSPTNFWGIGGLVRWQANQNATRARIAQAQATSRLALANFDGVVLAALQDLELALNNYAHDLAREDSSMQSVKDAEQALKDAERLQVGGRATSLTVVDAQRAYATAEQTLAQLETSISNDQIAIFLALGGGWNTAPELRPQQSTRAPNSTPRQQDP